MTLRMTALMSLLCLLSCGVDSRQEDGGRGFLQTTLADASISIDYGRPELKGRDMVARLQSGQVWRLGMNESAVLQTDKDLKFGESVIEAGRYSLFVRRVGDQGWTLIFNSEPDIWGTQRKPGKDVAEVPMERESNHPSIEKFTMRLEAEDSSDGEVVMEWDSLRTRVRFTVIQ